MVRTAIAAFRFFSEKSFTLFAENGTCSLAFYIDQKGRFFSRFFE
jgi:hypothetical protein